MCIELHRGRKPIAAGQRASWEATSTTSWMRSRRRSPRAWPEPSHYLQALPGRVLRSQGVWCVFFLRNFDMDRALFNLTKGPCGIPDEFFRIN